MLLHAGYSFCSSCEAAHEDIGHMRLRNKNHCPKGKARRKTGLGFETGLITIIIVIFIIVTTTTCF